MRAEREKEVLVAKLPEKGQTLAEELGAVVPAPSILTTLDAGTRGGF
jgi:hypothetical protein